MCRERRIPKRKRGFRSSVDSNRSRRKTRRENGERYFGITAQCLRLQLASSKKDHAKAISIKILNLGENWLPGLCKRLRK